MTRGSAASPASSWPCPTSIAVTCAAPRSSSTCVKPPVEAPMSSAKRPCRIEPEMVEAGDQLQRGARDIALRRVVDLDRCIDGNALAGLAGRPRPSTRTAPRSIASRARERVANSPRRTSSSSRRMRLSTGSAGVHPPSLANAARAGKLVRTRFRTDQKASRACARSPAPGRPARRRLRRGRHCAAEPSRSPS